jgi:hypothetical protein
MNQWIGCPSANFHHGRPFGSRPEAVVVHIMDGSFAAGESVFRDPTTQKSAHYGQISSVHDMRAAHGWRRNLWKHYIQDESIWG